MDPRHIERVTRESNKERGCTCAMESRIDIELADDGGYDVFTFHLGDCPLYTPRTRDDCLADGPDAEWVERG